QRPGTLPAKARRVSRDGARRRLTGLLRQHYQLAADVRGMKLALDREDAGLRGVEFHFLRLAARDDFLDLVVRNGESVLIRVGLDVVHDLDLDVIALMNDE